MILYKRVLVHAHINNEITFMLTSSMLLNQKSVLLIKTNRFFFYLMRYLLRIYDVIMIYFIIEKYFNLIFYIDLISTFPVSFLFISIMIVLFWNYKRKNGNIESLFWFKPASFGLPRHYLFTRTNTTRPAKCWHLDTP